MEMKEQVYYNAVALKDALMALPLGTEVTYRVPAAIAPNRPVLNGVIGMETTFGYEPRHKVIRTAALGFRLDMANPLDVEVKEP